jgi:hypothetical protein
VGRFEVDHSDYLPPAGAEAPSDERRAAARYVDALLAGLTPSYAQTYASIAAP